MQLSLFQRCTLLVLLILTSFPLLADDVWIDVRSYPEHVIDSIEGDLRVSHSDIVPEVEQRFPAKDTPIRLYCRSGGRAGKAMDALLEAGYTDVENIGGIDDARKQRGLAE